MRANATTADYNDECASKLLKAAIGKKDSVPGELLENQILVIIAESCSNSKSSAPLILFGSLAIVLGSSTKVVYLNKPISLGHDQTKNTSDLVDIVLLSESRNGLFQIIDLVLPLCCL